MRKLTRSAISVLLVLCFALTSVGLCAFGEEITPDEGAIFDSANGSTQESDGSFDKGKYYDEKTLPSAAFDSDTSTGWQLKNVDGGDDIDGTFFTLEPTWIGKVFAKSVTLGSLEVFWEKGSCPSADGGYSVQVEVSGVWTDLDATFVRTEPEDGIYKDTVTVKTPVASASFRLYVTTGCGRYDGNPKFSPSLRECKLYGTGAEPIEPEPAASSKVGAQRLKTANGLSTVRLISAVDSLDYGSVGFEVTVGNKVNTYRGHEVYTEVGTYYPADFGEGYKYLFCLTINDVPDNSSFSFRSFTQSKSGEQKFSPSSTVEMGEDDMKVNDVAESAFKKVTADYMDTALGDFIKLTPIDAKHAPLVNDSGMSGLWSGNQLHTYRETTPASMYAGSAAEDLVFDIGYADSLGKLFIWNYNNSKDLNSGIRSCEIWYSLDNKNWTKLDNYMLAKCSSSDNTTYGGNMSTNVAVTNLPIDFEGTVARYIRIRELTNWGGSKYGLSEIRLFRQKTTPKAGGLITPYPYTQQTLTGDDEAMKAVNGSGMSDRTSIEATCSANVDDMWLSTKNAASSLLVLDLDGNYPVGKVTLWNYNAAGLTNNGIKTFKLYYAVTDPHELKQNQSGKDDTIDWSRGGGWRQFGSTYTLPVGTGKDGMAPSLTVDMKNTHAQFIKIVPVANYGGTGFGLSEVRVTCGSGWMVEPSRYWNGVLSSSGSFAYQGNTSSNPFGDRNQGGGWVGGDGIFSTSLTGDNLQGQVDKDSKTFFSFQDSFTGNFGNYRTFNYALGYARSSGFGNGMKNMAYMFLSGDAPDVRNVQFYTELKNGLSNDNDLGNILPNSHNGKGYWIGDSTLVDGNLYTIATCIKNGWGTDSRYVFRQPLGSDGFPNMASEPVAIVKNTSRQMDANGYPTTFNRAFANEYFSMDQMFEEGEYIYFFGKKRGTGWLLEGQNMIVARMKKSDIPTIGSDSEALTYWNGSNWTLDMASAASISSCTPGNEFNVTFCNDGPFAGKYVCVYTDGSIWGTICIAVSDTLTGTYKNPSDYKIYFANQRYLAYYQNYTYEAYLACTDEAKPSYYNVYTQWNYNAKAQAAISKSGELLITYHFGNHDDRTPSWGYFGAVTKEYEHPTFVSLKSVK